MLEWILVGIGLYQVSLLLPVIFLVTRIGIHKYLLSRDDDPEPNVFHARAQRAHRNYLESLPLFLGLSILSLIVETADQTMALVGVQMFVIARAVYLPLYLFAVPYLRPLVWVVGMSGILVMISALL